MATTVWILGAGFSKSLGGPLLPQLFSSGSELKVKTHFPRLAGLQGDDAQLVRMLFSNAPTKQWEDAEEFLDYLDTAQLGGEAAPSYQALIEMIQRVRNQYFAAVNFLAPLHTRDLVAAKIEPITKMSRRLLAAECSAFLVSADVNSEKWAPYRRWAEKMERGDVVITFNYDLVVERLAKVTEATPGEKFLVPTVVPPGESYPRQVTVLKLHGSVNWKKHLRQQHPDIFDISVNDDDYFALNCSEQEMVIASPGPTKLATAGGPLSMLWEAARAALKKANAVVFVGYRFPPTDSAARRELIDAIGKNERDYLVLHTVLGPNVRSPDAERLTSMLEVAMQRKGAVGRNVLMATPTPRYDLNVHPLWAEDFLDLYDPGQLARP